MGALQVLFPSDPKMDSIGFHGIGTRKRGRFLAPSHVPERGLAFVVKQF